jgi:hypothetical protein
MSTFLMSWIDIEGSDTAVLVRLLFGEVGDIISTLALHTS